MARAAGAAAGRWDALDSARGVAMAFVCVSHFGRTFFAGAPPGGVRSTLLLVGMVASPMFIVISGLMLGFLGASRPAQGRTRLLLRYLDRGLFLLLIGRFLIVAALAPGRGLLHTVLRFEFITDTIGLCMIVAPVLVFRWRPVVRVAVSAGLLACSWTVTLLWSAHGRAEVAKELMFGALPLTFFDYAFPVVPWFCVFLAATAAGGPLHDLRREGRQATASRRLYLAAAGCAGAAVAGNAIHRVAQQALGPASPLAELTTLAQKVPPGPVYLAIYGGAGLLLLGAVIDLERRGLLRSARALAALVGRNSLFAFILQFFVYNAGALLLRPAPSALWPLWLLASLALVVLPTAVWDRFDGNRLLTVGLRNRSGPALRPQPS